MSCERYTDSNIKFSENDDTCRCLCTFPENDDFHLEPSRIKSLALLGAAVVLDQRGQLDNPYLPYGIPQWIIGELNRVMGE